jgi:hypothetical protein
MAPEPPPKPELPSPHHGSIMRGRIERWAEVVWTHKITTFVLLCAPYVVSICLYLWHQLPGVAGVLLGGIAAIMAFRDMHHTHKLLFTGAILLLVFLEFRDIRVDRLETDAKALSDRRAQDLQFKNIRDTQDQDFKTTAGGLQAAIDGIESTLISAKKTLIQTQPHAAVHFVGGFQILDSPVPPTPFKADVSYTFRSNLANDGSDDATMLRMLRKIYIGKPDDKIAQDDLALKFEMEWSQVKRLPSRFVRQQTGFRTDPRIFTEPEIKDLDMGETIYMLRRLEYSDQTGTWISEDCQHLQVQERTMDIRIGHPCAAFDRNRARVR